MGRMGVIDIGETWCSESASSVRLCALALA